MSTSDEPVADSAAESTEAAANRAAETGVSRSPRQATTPSAGPTPASVTAIVLRSKKMGSDEKQLAQLCYEQLSVRLIAGWPEWAVNLGHINLTEVVAELHGARQKLAKRVGGDKRGPAAQAEADWLHQWVERLTHAGWMPIGDQSADAVAGAVETAIMDCNTARKLAPYVNAVVLELGTLKIIT